MEIQLDKSEIIRKVILELKNIYDPEIPVNIYDLGLVYEVNISDDYVVKIVMTLTTPNCPVAESLPEEVIEKVKMVTGVKDCDFELTFEPPWDRDMISEAALLDLGLL
jgi:FeS assembly SUF system protein